MCDSLPAVESAKGVFAPDEVQFLDRRYSPDEKGKYE